MWGYTSFSMCVQWTITRRIFLWYFTCRRKWSMRWIMNWNLWLQVIQLIWRKMIGQTVRRCALREVFFRQKIQHYYPMRSPDVVAMRNILFISTISVLNSGKLINLIYDVWIWTFISGNFLIFFSILSFSLTKWIFHFHIDIRLCHCSTWLIILYFQRFIKFLVNLLDIFRR